MALRLNLACRNVSFASTRFKFSFDSSCQSNDTTFSCYSLIFMNGLVSKEFEFATSSGATST